MEIQTPFLRRATPIANKTQSSRLHITFSKVAFEISRLGFPKGRLDIAAKLLDLMSNLLNLLSSKYDATVGEKLLGLLRIENENFAFANTFFDVVTR